VSGSPAPVTTSSSSLAQIVDSQRIERLPLNGRNALQLVALVPGVVQVARIGQFGMTQLAFEVSGGRNIDMNFSLDGDFNMNTFCNSAADYPNPDALQEFSVSTRTVSAVFGLCARADRVQAQPMRRHSGGPIVKNRLFFFASYQGTKERGSPGERRYRSLSASERSGDFSGFARALLDPDSAAPFTGNRIPASRFISTFPPTPNSGPDFFTLGTAQTLDQDQIVTKVYAAKSRASWWCGRHLRVRPQPRFESRHLGLFRRPAGVPTRDIVPSSHIVSNTSWVG
jgi:hypothetical protein